uniref:Ribosomal protein S7 n=1 Tax=Rhizophora mucronata TaxID=61149 RepID=A0A2P2LMP5_RHIMU
MGRPTHPPRLHSHIRSDPLHRLAQNDQRIQPGLLLNPFQGLIDYQKSQRFLPLFQYSINKHVHQSVSVNRVGFRDGFQIRAASSSASANDSERKRRVADADIGSSFGVKVAREREQGRA